uniref:Monodehydroascorbate reductase n=1 Tax=Tanacetum cinerariifolium TaxID=118510 RepID=A0A6L2JJH6_TANCI|nr:monodehydroascorbate reductase [Tanacetum cinerariifolium]
MRYDSTTGIYSCQLDEQWFNLYKDILKDAIQITPINDNDPFVAPPSSDEIIDYVNTLGYPYMLQNVSAMSVNDLYQPWRAILSMINMCLTGKTAGHDRPRHPVLQILWGIIHRSNIDYAERIWEEFVQSIQSFFTDKKRLTMPSQGKKKDGREVFAEEAVPKSPAPKVSKPKTSSSQPPKPKTTSTKPSKEIPKKKQKLVKETPGEPSPAKRSKGGLVGKRRKPKSPLKLVDEFVDEGVPMIEPRIDDEEADLQQRIKLSLKDLEEKNQGPTRPVVFREPDSWRLQPLLKRRTPMTTGPSGNAKSPSLDVELADSETESDKKVTPVNKEKDASNRELTEINSRVQDEGLAGLNPDLAVFDSSTQQNPKQMDEEFTTTAYQNVQENLKLPTEDQVTLKEPASSIGTLSSLQNLEKELSFTNQFFMEKTQEEEPEKTNAESEVQSMVMVPIRDLEQHMENLIQDKLALEERLDKHGSYLYNLENLNIPQNVSKAVDEIVTDAHDDHENLFEALQKSLKCDYSNQLLADLDEAHRKKRKKHDLPRTHFGSPPPQPPPPPPPAGTSGAPDYLMNDDSIPDEAVHLSDDEDTKNDHLPKADMRKDWWKPLPKEERPATPEPGWTIPSFNVLDFENNWATALASTYVPPAENSLLAKTRDMTTFMNWYCEKVNKTVLTQVDFKGHAYEVFKAFYRNDIHLQFQMEECHKMLTDQITTISTYGFKLRVMKTLVSFHILLLSIKNTLTYEAKTGVYSFQLDETRFLLYANLLRDALEIMPIDQAHQFMSSSLRDAIIDFVNQLGYNEVIHFVLRMAVNNLYQPWRAILSMINQCLTSKISGHDRPRYTILQMIWGIITCTNVDYVELLWEEFVQAIQTFLTDKANLGTSPFHLAEEDIKLGNLKFVPKGEINEVFGMLIPDKLISNNIRNAPHYNVYLEMVAKHDLKMSAEKEGNKKTASKERPSKASADKPPKPKPAKEKSTKTTLPQPTDKGKVVKVRKGKSPFQLVNEHDEEPAHSEPEPKLVHQGEGDEDDMELTNSGDETEILHIDEDQGKGVDDQVNLDEKTDELDQGHAGSDLEPEPTYVEFMADLYIKVQESLKFPADKHVMLEEPLSSFETLSSMKNLDDSYTIRDQFINDKSMKDEPASSTKAPIFIATTTTTTTNLPLPPPPLQQSMSDFELVARVTILKQKLTAFKQKSKTLDNITQNLRSKVFNLELRDLPHKIDEAVRESVREVVCVTLQASLRDRFRELPEADMKEILHQRMFKIGSYKSLPEHVALYKALEASMERQRPEWSKPLLDNKRPATLEPAWVIPSSHIPDAKNNWANVLATTYQDIAENSLLENTGDIQTFMHCKGSGQALSISKMKVARYLDFGLELLVPEHMWINERVEDFQLGIESYQKQLNLTKPGWDAKGFKYKHDYIIIDPLRAVVFPNGNNERKIMRMWKGERNLYMPLNEDSRPEGSSET